MFRALADLAADRPRRVLVATFCTLLVAAAVAGTTLVILFAS